MVNLLVTIWSYFRNKPLWVMEQSACWYKSLCYPTKYKVGWGGGGMDSPVGQLVEHSKLHREVPGLFPGWGIRFFPPKRQDCQRHLFATMDGYHNFTIIHKQSRGTWFIEDKLFYHRSISCQPEGLMHKHLYSHQMVTAVVWEGRHGFPSSSVGRALEA